MFVPCPHCGFLLALTDADDGAPQRCPRCEAALPAGGTAAPVPAATAATTDPDAGAADITTQVEGATPDPVATLVEAAATVDPAPGQASASLATTPPPPARPRRGKPGTPSFARKAHAQIPLGPRWPGLMVITVLLLVLAAQLLLIQREALAASAQWRPMIVRVCAALLCELPPWHEPSAITMLDRGVQPHPRRPGVLAVQASFRNDARWPQPWPMLLLSLADIEGRPVAQGVFAPDEYGAPADAPTLLAPGQTASVRFAVREPGPRSVAFSFEFR